MAEHPVTVSTGTSDITMPTEDGNDEMIPDPEHIRSLEPKAIVAANDPVLSPTDVYTPTDSLLRDRIMTPSALRDRIMTPSALPGTNPLSTQHSPVRVSPVRISGLMDDATGMPLGQPSPSYNVFLSQQMIDARRVIINQDTSPMVPLAAEARHSDIIGQLSMEHQEQLRNLYNEGFSEVARLRSELDRANTTLSVQRADMVRAKPSFITLSNYAKENALIEASTHARNAMRATEEIRQSTPSVITFAKW